MDSGKRDGASGRQAYELYREQCRDDDGNRYIAMVWRSHPDLATTFYTREDGTPVHFEGDCVIPIVPTGEQ